ncbi:MAG: hypothetical protein IJ622_10230 [Bacteroidales bacterium]|nr:hypothetical protein [Bacteroidales bacterium]
MAQKDVKKELDLLMKGRTEEQKNALKYFYQYKGCIFGHLMTDQEYEQMVVKMINSTDWKKKALAKIGMEEEDVQEVRPIHFEGFDYTPKNSLSLYGKDMKWRSSHYQISWVFCSATQVYVWQYTFSTIDDTKKERTEEYFYKDITNFSTVTETIEKEVPVKTTCKGDVEFGLKNVEDKQFSIIVPGDRLNCQMEDEDDTLEASIQGLKAKLREKKNA